MLQKLREWLVLILIILLPFHAFLVTVGTRLLVGAGHAPLPWLAGWKEATLALVVLLALVEVVQNEKLKMKNEKLLMDVLDVLILGICALGFLISIFNSPAFAEATAGKPFFILNFALGAKYTLFPLLLFIVLRRVPWSAHFLLLTSYFLLLIGAVVAGYGILTVFLPESFFTWLGYSDLHSTYLPDGPIAAFQKLEGTGIRRIQSTFSGPNQLGIWLLIPWSVLAVFLLREWERVRNKELGIRSKEFLLLTSYFLLLLLCLFFTFSRAAWLGAAVIAITAFLVARSPFRVLPWRLLGGWVVGWLGLAAIGIMVFPTIFARGASSSEHWRRPMEAIRTIAAHPLGLGLGSAGPAQNRLSDSCVFLADGVDTSWAKDRPNLCVFVGNQQVQPLDRVCRCPLLPENWYLQVGVELGVLGMMLFVALVVLLIFRLLPTSYFLLPFVGVSVAALFLHAWEDSAVAYTVWILLAIDVPSPNGASVHCRSRLRGSVRASHCSSGA